MPDVVAWIIATLGLLTSTGLFYLADRDRRAAQQAEGGEPR